MNDRDKRVVDAMLRHCEEIIDTLKRCFEKTVSV